MTGLHHLAPELLIQILSSIDSPAGLCSLVAASSACFRTYSLYQGPILLQVLVNSLSSQLIKELLAIVNLPRLRSKHDNSIDLLRPFVERYFSTEPFDIPLYNIDVVSVRRAYTAINRLTNIYFTHASTPLVYSDKTKHPIEEPPKLIPLSAAEKDRIQRAFYRYELYSQLFPQGERARDSPREAMTQFDLFLRHMTPWELEELACIHHFLVNMIEGFMEDLDDEIFDTVVSSPGVRGESNCRPCRWSLSDLNRVTTVGPRRIVFPTSCSFPVQRKSKRSPSPSPTGPIYPSRYRPSDEVPPKGHVAFSSLDHYGLEMFGRDFRERAKSGFIGKLASLGLGFILDLMDAPSPSHRRLLIQSQTLTGREFLPEALDWRPRNMQPPSASNHDMDGIDLRDGPTAQQQRIPAFLFFNRGTNYVSIYNHVGDIKWDSLRAIGYLFWDEARWQSPIAQKAMVMSWNFASIVTQERPERGNSSLSRFLRRRLSVEERLRGVSIPAEEMRRIGDVFGRKGGVR
ncbi:hypothetical protein V8F33_010200 [Rhypophila sp. PSN 637]